MIEKLLWSFYICVILGYVHIIFLCVSSVWLFLLGLLLPDLNFFLPSVFYFCFSPLLTVISFSAFTFFVCVYSFFFFLDFFILSYPSVLFMSNRFEIIFCPVLCFLFIPSFFFLCCFSILFPCTAGFCISSLPVRSLTGIFFSVISPQLSLLSFHTSSSVFQQYSFSHILLVPRLLFCHFRLFTPEEVVRLFWLSSNKIGSMRLVLSCLYFGTFLKCTITTELFY